MSNWNQAISGFQEIFSQPLTASETSQPHKAVVSYVESRFDGKADYCVEYFVRVTDAQQIIDQANTWRDIVLAKDINVRDPYDKMT